jgi:hypothetical protein
MSDRAEGTATGQAGHRHAIQLDSVPAVSCTGSPTGQTRRVLPAVTCDATAQPRRPRRIWPKGRP